MCGCVVCCMCVGVWCVCGVCVCVVCLCGVVASPSQLSQALSRRRAALHVRRVAGTRLTPARLLLRYGFIDFAPSQSLFFLVVGGGSPPF